MTSIETLAARLPDLIDELREAGYVIGTEQYVAAQDLLLALAARDALPPNPWRYQTLLGPIFCKSAQEQEDFKARYTRWITLDQPSSSTESTASLQRQLNDIEVGVKVWSSVLVALSIAALAAMLCTARAFWSAKPGDRSAGEHASPAAPPQLPLSKTLTAASDSTGRLSVPRTPAPAVPPAPTVSAQPVSRGVAPDSAVPLQPGSLPPSPELFLFLASGRPERFEPGPTTSVSTGGSETLIQAYSRGESSVALQQRDSPKKSPPDTSQASGYPILGTLLLLLVSAFLGWRLWWFHRSRPFLARLATGEAPDLARVSVKLARSELFQDVALSEVATKLRHRRPIASGRIDVRATVLSAVRKGGWVTPVRGKSLVLPEYLVLIDRASHDDHQAQYFDELIVRLVEDDVIVVRYDFDGDPRICQSAGSAASVATLRNLAARYCQHRLLIISNGAGLIDPMTAELVPWADQLSHWPDRTLLTPEPTDQWGYTELTLARHGLVVLPATEEGLAALADPFCGENSEVPSSSQLGPPFPGLLRERPRRWLERRAPETKVLRELLEELRSYLGDDGYDWLAACAVYPELRWELTLHLGYNLRTPAGLRLLDPRRLTALARLPWFRHGSMPDWLRLALIRSLDRKRERATRTLLQTLLLTASQVHSDGHELEIAKEHRGILAPLARQIVRKLRRQVPPDSPLREYVFARWMSGGRLSPLALELPLSLGVLSGRQASRFFPLVLGILVTAIVGVGLFELWNRPGSSSKGKETGNVAIAKPKGPIQRIDQPDGVNKRPEWQSGQSYVDIVKSNATAYGAMLHERHAGAYNSLFGAKSRAIAYGISLGTRSPMTAHDNIRCLSCHTGSGLDAAATVVRRENGIGCAVCHLPLDETGLSRPHSERDVSLAFENLDLWAARCVTCHVGATGRDVDHLLLRAGHPRLNFEFVSFMPPQWKEGTQGNFPARAWAIGQVVSARAALELLRARAKAATRDPRHWPEFAEYDCLACHHDMYNQEWRWKRPDSRAGRGLIPWGTWYYAMSFSLGAALPSPATKTVSDELTVLRGTMERSGPDPGTVVAQVDSASAALEQWLVWLKRESRNHGAPEIKALISSFRSPDDVSGWEEAAQHFLALQTLRASLKSLDPTWDDAPLSTELNTLSTRLNSRTGYSPDQFYPTAPFVQPQP